MAADKNLESYAGENGVLIENRTIAPDEITPISDTLKFSNCNQVAVKNCVIYGGKEDCIDAVRGSDYTFENIALYPNGKNGITLKGSISGYKIENVSFLFAGTNSDIEVGQYDNYWYIGRPPTRNGQINNVFSSAEDNTKVVLKVWDAEVPRVTNSEIKIVKIPKFIWWPYFVFRAIQTRGFKNLFKPVAPSAFIQTK